MTVSPSTVVSPKGTKKVAVALSVATAGAGLAFSVLTAKRRKELFEIQRNALVARHNLLRKDWEEFLAEPERVLDNPELMLYNHEIGRELSEAFRTANMLRPFFMNGKPTRHIHGSAYYNAVLKAEFVWNDTQRRSEEIGDKELTAEQARSLKKARTQLKHLKNPQKSVAEKRRAYNAFQKEIASVMKLDRITVKALEDYLK